MVCIEKCLHFKRKCRHHPHPILDILPVYLTRGISKHTMGSFFVKMFEMLLEGNKEKRQSTLFYLKFFVFYV